MTTTSLGHLPRTSLQAPDGRDFPWGPIQQVHQIGRYQVVEFLSDVVGFTGADLSEHGKPHFHPYVDGKDTSRSFGTLEEAVVHAIAVAHDPAGANTRAATYFARMVGLA